MPYYLSTPLPRKRVTFFRPKQPNRQIFPDVELGMDGVHWIKYILCCVNYKGVDLGDVDSIVDMILDPNWGVYNRCLLWSYEVSRRKEDFGSGFFVARNWNYGIQARASGRDYVNFAAFGKLLNDILSLKKSKELVEDWNYYKKEDLLRGEFEEFVKRFEDEVLGANLATFPVKEFFSENCPTSGFKDKDKFTRDFVSSFVTKFSEVKGVKEMMESHSIINYVRFVVNQMGISKADDIKSASVISPKEALLLPGDLKPHLSDKGYDAFLLLGLLKDSPLFVSFIFQSYLDKQNVDYLDEYLNLREETSTSDFAHLINDLEELLKEYKHSFKANIPRKKLEHGAVWWEFNQFEYMMQLLSWEAYQLFINDEDIRKIFSVNLNRKRLRICLAFLKSYNQNHDLYVKYISGTDFESHLEEIDQIEVSKEGILKAIRESIPQEKIEVGGPMFVGMDQFQKWSRTILKSLKGT